MQSDPKPELPRCPLFPSGLWFLALRDLERCSRDPDYILDSRYFHEPDPVYDRCRIGFSGALAARTLRTPLDANPARSDFTNSELPSSHACWATALGLIETYRRPIIPAAVRQFEKHPHSFSLEDHMRDHLSLAWHQCFHVRNEEPLSIFHHNDPHRNAHSFLNAARSFYFFLVEIESLYYMNRIPYPPSELTHGSGLAPWST